MARSISELRAQLQSFPDPDQVKNVCKPGQGATTCRYLSVSPGRNGVGYACEKATGLRYQIDERVKAGTMGAQGDNCEGLLGVINDNQGLLLGNKTVHHEEGEDYPEEPFKGINVDESAVGVAGFGIAKDFVQINIRDEGIVFTAPYLGYATVYFEKPKKPQGPTA
jgi:hypothetical protein